MAMDHSWITISRGISDTRRRLGRGSPTLDTSAIRTSRRDSASTPTPSWRPSFQWFVANGLIESWKLGRSLPLVQTEKVQDLRSNNSG